MKSRRKALTHKSKIEQHKSFKLLRMKSRTYQLPPNGVGKVSRIDKMFVSHGNLLVTNRYL